MNTELSGALLWIGGNFIFETIFKICQKVKSKFLKEGGKKMKNNNGKNVKNLLKGMFTVATVFGA